MADLDEKEEEEESEEETEEEGEEFEFSEADEFGSAAGGTPALDEEGKESGEEKTPPDSPREEEDADGLPFWKLIGYTILAGVCLVAVGWVIDVLVTDHLKIGRLEEQMTEQTDKVKILTNSVSDLSASVSNLDAIADAHENSLSLLRNETVGLRASTTEALDKAVAAGKTGASAEKIARSVRKDLTAHVSRDSALWAVTDSVRRSTVAVDSVTVSQIRLAADGAVRKADAVLVRADSLDAARERHEAALADLASRMGGKKKK